MSSLPGADSASPRSASSAQGGVHVREGVLELSSFDLHFGGRLEGARLAWRLTGNTGGPIVLALGGISAGRNVAGDGQSRGWWHEVVGAGLALDTAQTQILGIDFLGGSGETTGPRRGQTDFPSISAYDQAQVVRQLLDHLQILELDLLVGASYGGMVGLAFAERYPDRIRHLVSISAAHRSHPMSTAWRSVQRAIVRYAAEKGDGGEGLRLARALAMATYRSSDEFDKRFSGEPQRVNGQFRFPVENYLLSRGDAYAATYIPEAFVCLSESIDLHRVDPAQINVPTTLVAVREDQLVPIGDMRSLAQSLAGPAELIELSSLYGHDAFLKESAALRSVFANALHA
ncbi:MAG TPA: homoserine O-succinyltransferase [Steroidobacteraceae bacterium]|nr:homoserine O-succinyltransferase [Steroidobacteraceae bacterium]